MARLRWATPRRELVSKHIPTYLWNLVQDHVTNLISTYPVRRVKALFRCTGDLCPVIRRCRDQLFQNVFSSRVCRFPSTSAHLMAHWICCTFKNSIKNGSIVRWATWSSSVWLPDCTGCLPLLSIEVRSFTETKGFHGFLPALATIRKEFVPSQKRKDFTGFFPLLSIGVRSFTETKGFHGFLPAPCNHSGYLDRVRTIWILVQDK